MRRFVGIVLSVFFIHVSAAQAFDLNASSYVFGHPQSGSIVMQEAANEKTAPASLAKMMTLYLLFEAIEDGVIGLDDTIPVSEKAWRMGGSKMFIEVGKKIRVEDLIKGIAVSSGNDACIAVAEYLGGSEDGFVIMMNSKAEEFGMTNTNFMNASGWPHEEQHTTAMDVYKLASHLYMDFPEFRDYFHIPNFTYSNIKQNNRNGLIRREFANMEVTGLKTGHIEEAGFHLASSAHSDGTVIIGVVMGTDSMGAREAETLKALTYIFNNYRMYNLVGEGQVVEKDVPVWAGQKDDISLAAGEGVNVFMSRAQRGDLKSEITYKKPVVAPIEQGQQVGTLTINYSDKQQSVPLVASTPVGELSFTDKLGWIISHNLSN